MKVRAKLYVSSKSFTYLGTVDGSYVPATNVSIVLSPVYSQNPNSENHKYWSASPSGKLTLQLSESEAEKFNPGDFFYVDSERIEDPEFKPDGSGDGYVQLQERTETTYGRLGIVERSRTACFELSIDNQNVFGEYDRLGAWYSFEIIAAPKDAYAI